MAVSSNRQLRDGGDIMLFVPNGSSYTSIAHGTSHSLSLSADTESINTKDAGIYGMNEVSKINWEITANHMYTDEGYDTFFSYMTNKTKINVLFGTKATSSYADVNITEDGAWTPKASYVYGGQAVISNLDWQADAGSKSTVSVTLQGQGAIAKVSTVS